MKRSDEIIKAALPYIDEPQAYRGFIFGADWADKNPHWISVKDKLPEFCNAVLTTTQYGTQRVGIYDGGWWLANTPDLRRMSSITHWMPLPELPKGGEQ